MTFDHGLAQRHIDCLRGILSPFAASIERVVIFGSRASGKYRPDSDIDIALYGPVEEKTVNRLHTLFMDSPLPMTVDIQAYEHVQYPPLRRHIDMAGKTLFTQEALLERVAKGGSGKFGEGEDMTRWRKVSFGELLKEPVRNGIYKPKEFHGDGVKIINMGELFAHPRVRDVYMRRVQLTDKEKIKNLLQNGDLIFARRSLTAEGAGKCSIIFDIAEETTFESSIIRARPDSSQAIPLFLFYFFNSPYGLYLIGTILRQVAVAGITGTDLSALELSIPSPSEQKAIASVLSSLDDKIDLLHRQNVTLEAMAEALFRQWFVVETKEEWTKKPLLHHIQLVGGGTPKTSVPEYWNGSIDWLAGGDIANNHRAFAFSSEKSITEEGVRCSSAKILPQYTTVLTARGTVGKFCLLGKPMAYSQTNYGILPKNSKLFFFTFLLIDHIVKELQAAAYGSVFDTITMQTFEETSIALPERNIVENFDSQVRIYFEKIFSNQTQIHTLEKLRDMLLPKLMNGEVRVRY